MVSISSLLRFLFVFNVVTFALVGFLFDEIAFLRLGIINGLLLLFICIILRFSKSSKPISHGTKKDGHLVTLPVEDNKDEDDSIDESLAAPVSSKGSNASRHEQVVKYTYRAKKKRSKSLFVWLFVLVLAVIGYLLINPSLVSLNIGDSPVVVSGSQTLPILNTGSIVESTGEVLSTGIAETSSTGIVVDTSFVSTGDTVSVVPTNNQSTITFTDTQSVSLLEAVVYLLQTHNTPLLNKKDVKFSGVSTTNQYYTYRYTAYKMGLVGKASSPSAKVSCQTYMVIKGMIEKWNIQYTPSNVKTVFWNEAEKQGVLNGCTFGTILKGANLK